MRSPPPPDGASMEQGPVLFLSVLRGLRTLAKGVQRREQTDEGRVSSDGLWQVQKGGRGCSAWLGFSMASPQASCVSAAAVS